MTGSDPGPDDGIVYIVEDDEAMRSSLLWLVESVGLTVRAFANASDFLEAHDPTRPGCLVLDVRMPGMGGFELQEALESARATLPIIFVSGHGDVPMSVRAMKKGAFDFIQKPFNSQTMLDCIQAALREGASRFERRREQLVVEAKLAQLSPRERSVLDKVVEGKSSKQIAHELGISSKTVDVHRASIREKFAVKSVAELIKMVLSNPS